MWQHIELDQGKSDWREHDVEALSEYLRRSAAATISFTMSAYCARIPIVWTLLLAEAHRWRSVRFVLHDVEKLSSTISFDQPLEVPALKCVSMMTPITLLPLGAIDLTDNPVRWFSDAPRIRYLSLAWPFLPPVVHVAWDRITHLELDWNGPDTAESESLRGCVGALQQCVALEYLEVFAYKLQWGEPLPIIELPTLQTLVLDKDAVVLCCYLRVPRLERLSFCPNTFLLSVDRCEALTMLARRQSLQRLRYLYLTYSLFEWAHLNPMLEQLPELTDLHLIHSPFRSSRGTPPRVCSLGQLRSLRTLSLDISEAEWYLENQLPGLPELLEAEITKLSNLEKLDLWNRPEQGARPDLDEWIDRQSKRGVEVERRSGWHTFPDEMDLW
ncbi:hypothetical protein EV714DRAFT_203588 [Schizophyllum commune]